MIIPCQVEEEEAAGEDEQDEVDDRPTGDGIHAHVHDGCPALQRDALEDGQPRVLDVVEVGDAVV